jgi:hypothetical protein
MALMAADGPHASCGPLDVLALRRVNGAIARRRKNRDGKKEANVREYEVAYEVVGSGGGVVKETVTAASEFNARNLIYAKYRGQTVRIVGARLVR